MSDTILDNKNIYPKFKNDYLLTIIILVESENNNIKTQLENLLSISKLNLSIFEVLIYECERIENKRYSELLNKFKSEMPNLRVIKRPVNTYISNQKGFIEAMELSNGKFIRLLKDNDYLLKESFKLLLNILSHQTPDILVSNVMVFDEDEKKIFPIHYFQKNLKEGLLKKYDNNIYPSLYLLTFRKSLLSKVNLDDLGDSPWIFRYIPMICVSNSETIYSTKSYMQVIRTSDEKNPLFQRALSLRNKENFSVLLRMIEDIDFSNEVTSKASIKFLMIYLQNYLHFVGTNDVELAKKNAYIFTQNLKQNKTIKNNWRTKFVFKFRRIMVRNFEKRKLYNPNTVSKKEGNIEIF